MVPFCVGAVFIALLSVAYGAYELKCEPEYTMSQGMCFKGYLKETVDFNTAEGICKADGGHLPSIHDSATNDFLVKTFGNIFIGLVYKPANDSYEWTDGSAPDFTSYDSDFLAFRDYFGYCAQLGTGTWKNAECEIDKQLFACAKNAGNVTETAADTCPDPSVAHLSGGMLMSPGYPDVYNGTVTPLNCTYRLAAKNGYRIRIVFDEFQLGFKNSSMMDYLQFYEGWNDNTSPRWTLSPSSQQFDFWTFESNKMLIHFSALMTGTWHANWISELPPKPTYSSPERCPESTYYHYSGVISSPGYPEDYSGSSYLQCQYVLNGDSYSKMTIKFGELVLGSSSSGGLDTITLYDGYSANSSSLIATLDKNSYAVGRTFKTWASSVMIVLFKGYNTGKWQAAFYSEQVNQNQGK